MHFSQNSDKFSPKTSICLLNERILKHWHRPTWTIHKVYRQLCLFAFQLPLQPCLRYYGRIQELCLSQNCPGGPLQLRPVWMEVVGLKHRSDFCGVIAWSFGHPPLCCGTRWVPNWFAVANDENLLQQATSALLRGYFTVLLESSLCVIESLA